MEERPQLRLVAYALAAALLVFAVVKGLGSRAEGSSPPVRIAEGGGGGARDAPGGGGRSRSDDLYVHVAGAVRRPGVYRLRAGARVTVAVERAGGPTRRADLDAVNLAAPLEDGQQVIVPRRGASGAGGSAAGGAPGGAGASAPGGGAAGGKLILATATVEQLDQLDGIGPTLAQRIVDYRDAHGGFRSIDELREVEGIGEKRFAALRDAVRP